VPDPQIVLRRYAERIGYPVEECEHRRDVNRLRNLIFAPTGIAEFLHIGVRRLIGAMRDDFYVIEQGSLRRRQPRLV
jgi:hypothetical protein